MVYQLTGDERYIQAFRRKKALKAALMAGSLGGKTAGESQEKRAQRQVFNTAWPPGNLPKRCGIVALILANTAAWSSWFNTRQLVGELSLPQMEGLKAR